MTQLTIGYSDSEDRLWLLLSEDDYQFWMTRRLCGNFLITLARELAASCPGIEYGAQQDPELRIALEHETAHEHAQELRNAAPSATKPSTVEATPTIKPRQSHLLSSINMTLDSQILRLELITNQGGRAMQLNRGESHQLLSTLWLHSQAAGWHLQVPKWVKHPVSGSEEQ